MESFNDPYMTTLNGTNVYFVSPTGNDSNNGKSRTSPLKTLEGAINKIDSSSGNLSKATVLLEDGEYPISSRVNLRGSKFGNTCQVDIRGIGNNATFTGAVTLDNSKFTQTSMNGTTVYQYDLSSYNLNYTYGNSISVYEDTMGNLPDAPFIIMNGEKADIASYPSRYDLVDIGRNGNASSSSFTITLPSNIKSIVSGFSKLTSEVFLHCYYQSEYFSNIYRITKYSSSSGVLTMGSVPFDYDWGSCCSCYISSKGMKARFMNVKEQLKNPGEYYIDYSNKRLYVIPPANTSINNTKIQLAYQTFGDTSQGVFHGETNSDLNIVFERVNFDGFRSTIFKDGLANTKFYKCIFKNSNGSLFEEINDANRIEFRQCKFGHASAWGIKLDNSGTRTSSEISSGEVKIYNCIFNDIGFNNSQSPYIESIYLGQLGNCVGAEVRGNKIFLNSGLGIVFGGNDNIFDDNIFDSQCYESGDSGALYSGRNWTFRGNEITNNKFKAGYMYHHEDDINMAIYLDDMMSSALVKGNVIENWPIGMMFGGGRDNTIVNNSIYGGSIPIYFDSRGLSSDLNEINTNSRQVNFKSSTWTSKYPAISTLNYSTNTNDVAKNGQPYGNIIQDNTGYDCTKWYTIDEVLLDYNCTISNNVINRGSNYNNVVDFEDWEIEDTSQISIVTMSGTSLEATINDGSGVPFAAINLAQGTAYTVKADACNVDLVLYDQNWENPIVISGTDIQNGYALTPTVTYAMIALFTDWVFPANCKITNLTIYET